MLLHEESCKQICDYLDLPSLKEFRLTCKSINAIVEDILWRHVRIDLKSLERINDPWFEEFFSDHFPRYVTVINEKNIMQVQTSMEFDMGKLSRATHVSIRLASSYIAFLDYRDILPYGYLGRLCRNVLYYQASQHGSLFLDISCSAHELDVKFQTMLDKLRQMGKLIIRLRGTTCKYHFKTKNSNIIGSVGLRFKGIHQRQIKYVGVQTCLTSTPKVARATEYLEMRFSPHFPMSLPRTLKKLRLTACHRSRGTRIRLPVLEELVLNYPGPNCTPMLRYLKPTNSLVRLECHQYNENPSAARSFVRRCKNLKVFTFLDARATSEMIVSEYSAWKYVVASAVQTFDADLITVCSVLDFGATNPNIYLNTIAVRVMNDGPNDFELIHEAYRMAYFFRQNAPNAANIILAFKARIATKVGMGLPKWLATCADYKAPDGYPNCYKVKLHEAMAGDFNVSQGRVMQYIGR